MTVAFENHAWQSAALVRQSFGADGEKRPRGGLDVLSGRIYRRCFPRAEALGCSVFALRATAECPNSTRALLATPGSCEQVRSKRPRPI